MAQSNVQLLTRGSRVYAKKKRTHRVEAVTYDALAREQYLTGFHKRKVQRREVAEAANKEKERQAKLEERRVARMDRAKIAEEGLKQLEEAERLINGYKNEDDEQEEEFKGFSDSSGILRSTYHDIDGNETNVTVQNFKIDAYVDMSRADEVLEESTQRANAYAKYVNSLSGQHRDRDQRPISRRKKFRYLSKVERKRNAQKDRRRRR